MPQTQVNVSKIGPAGHAHKLVAKIAEEAAKELYEVVMGDNVIRAEWKRQNPGLNEKMLIAKFVKKNLAKCIPFARATLTRMLTVTVDEGLKEEILDALVLDASLRRGRGGNGVSPL
jgi:hypothetical protein